MEKPIFIAEIELRKRWPDGRKGTVKTTRRSKGYTKGYEVEHMLRRELERTGENIVSLIVRREEPIAPRRPGFAPAIRMAGRGSGSRAIV